MDESWEEWLSDLEMDVCDLFSERDMNSLEQVLNKGENIGFENLNLIKQDYASSEKSLLMLQRNLHSLPLCSAVPNGVPNKACQHHDGKESRKRKRVRSASQLRDHIDAERKRRENITNMFIALSSIIPGLKKMDKMSILSDAIDYVKCLENRVKDFEEQKKREIEYMACFKNIKVGYYNNSCGLVKPLKTFPNVEARVMAKDVLIRIMCGKRKDIVAKLMSMLSTHNLFIVCSNVMPFGNSTIITIVIKVDRELNMGMDDLVKILKEELLKWCNLQE